MAWKLDLIKKVGASRNLKMSKYVEFSKGGEIVDE